MTPEERFAAAKARYDAQFHVRVADTQELAAELNVPIGTTVYIREPLLYVGNAQDGLDDYLYQELIRNGGCDEGACSV